MGTPLKLLSPRLILSPNSLKFSNACRSTPEVVKKLIFQDQPKTPSRNLLTVQHEGFYQGNSQCDILINSPLKSKISHDGIFEEKNLKILGRGTFGRVIRATYKSKTVAMKVVKSPKNSGYLNEKNALNLDHENVIKMLEIIDYSPGNYAMIILEYAQGSKNLQNYLENIETDMEKHQLIKFSLDISQGLNYCHLKGVLHLDLKPGNILVCGQTCKIGDFGNSLKIEEKWDKIPRFGTIQYTAPEILEENCPSEKSDIFSLGVVFWQMKTRKMPYENLLSKEEILYKVVKYGLRPEKNLHCFYGKLCENCWEKWPKDRPSLKEIVEILNKC